MAVTLAEFHDALARHDWWYEMSDDNSKWERGDKEHRRLDRLKNSSPAHRSLYYAMIKFYKHGEDDKPERPQ
jgi:hypothetical protein